MGALLDLASWIALALGGFFYAVGGIGIVRMPDVFTRMHAASVSETLGLGLLVLGMVLQAGFTLVAVKLLIIFFMLMIVAPVSTHALARAALHAGRLPLLVNAKNWLVETDIVTLFPELGSRLRQPLSSEQVDPEGEAATGELPALPEGGFAYALEGDGSAAGGDEEDRR